MVKVDFLKTDAARQASIAADMRRRGIKLVAEKVESREQFQYALHLGYHYFQGYFFCKPQTLALQDIPCAKLSYIHVLSIANRNVYEVEELERAILREPSLCYRLLRYLNSAAFGLFPIRSIRHALTLLGQREIQKWVSIVVAISIASDRPGELISSALTRARSCEALAAISGEDILRSFYGRAYVADGRDPRLPDGGGDFTTATLRRVQGGASRKDNGLGKMLQLAVCCERGAWQEVSGIAIERGLPEDTIWDIYREARHWSSEILQENSLAAVGELFLWLALGPRLFAGKCALDFPGYARGIARSFRWPTTPPIRRKRSRSASTAFIACFMRVSCWAGQQLHLSAGRFQRAGLHSDQSHGAPLSQLARNNSRTISKTSASSWVARSSVARACRW